MNETPAVLLATVFLASCSSSGGVEVERFDAGSEEYRGPQTAAVAPVADNRSAGTPDGARGHTDMQRSIQRQLDQSGIFAGVVALERPDEGNEAEVIIEPALVGSGSHRGGDVKLRVRVTEKTNRRTVLDRTYGGSGGRADALNVAVSELEHDLAERYGR